MNWKEHIGVALAVTASAAGFGCASGRIQAVFYAQMGMASWLSITISALLYALFVAMISGLARRTGAQSFPDIYRRLLGCHAGRWIVLLYGFVLAIGGVLQLQAAANAGALMLPVRHAFFLALMLALGLSLLFAGLGNAAMKTLGGIYMILLVLFEIALWKWGRVDESRLNFAVNLRLENGMGAAVLMGVLHACVCAALSAGMAVHMTGARIRPRRLGLCCGLLLGLLTLWGNATLLCRDERLIGLKAPFAALASAWGSTGHYLCAGLVFSGAVITLLGILVSLFHGEPAQNMPEK